MVLGGSGWMDGSVTEVFESLLSSPCGFPSQWMVASFLQPVPLALSKVSSVPLKLAWAKGHLRSWGRKTVPGAEGWAACLLCPLPWHQHTWQVGVGSQSGSLFPSAFRFGEGVIYFCITVTAAMATDGGLCGTEVWLRPCTSEEAQRVGVGGGGAGCV